MRESVDGGGLPAGTRAGPPVRLGLRMGVSSLREQVARPRQHPGGLGWRARLAPAGREVRQGYTFAALVPEFSTEGDRLLENVRPVTESTLA